METVFKENPERHEIIGMSLEKKKPARVDMILFILVGDFFGKLVPVSNPPLFYPHSIGCTLTVLSLIGWLPATCLLDFSHYVALPFLSIMLSVFFS